MKKAWYFEKRFLNLSIEIKKIKNMNKEFCPYEIALALKELGFDEPCFGYYQKSSVIGDNTILPISFVDKASNFNDYEYSKLGVPFYSVPTFSQAFRWFREEYNFDSYIRPNIVIDIPKTYQFNVNDNTHDTWYETYEEAELACLKKLIGIVKNK